jgi:hypothetical protein
MYLWGFRSDDLLGLFWNIETASRRDIDGDGMIGPPVRESFEIVQTERKALGASHTAIIDIQGRPECFAKFAYAAVTGDSLAMDAWCGRDRPWSRADYIHNRQECIRLGWLEWRDPRNRNLGLDLTEMGEHGLGPWLEQYARAHAYATGGQLTPPVDME